MENSIVAENLVDSLFIHCEMYVCLVGFADG